ncbi:O-methyltransferase [Spirosoma montaniterrae]|uniref:SAM-dependent methyltransferase n=1 Tax=Spirosoma montaniterrae TaxID=1178516 RepID=A0A1P9WXL2_9BACT|nr:class I SAM-dependent methyltransferase [Spirosoma montaniterrae]AQG80100.1 SAM-dependent methyltransferase [Spirosoma montaniterrae]
MFLAYLRYLARARDEHSLHSPFLFSLYTTVIRADNRREAAFRPIRALRQRLLNNRHSIQITDYGAGSRLNRSNRRRISDIARTSQKSERFGRLLFRLLRHSEARTVLELGTSLGLTTAYLAEAVRPQQGRVLTFEGCPQTATVARRNVDELNLSNVEIIVGNLDQTLIQQTAGLSMVDLVFFDANHRYEPTVRYFETLLPYAHNDTVFVFDDIHWSADMERAWTYLKTHPAVTVTVDLFWVGLVFFRKEQPKQDFVLRF